MSSHDNASPFPSVSIAICTRDRADVLPGSIDAALAQENARHAPDILVIDNGSTDDTPAILREYASRYPVLRVIEEPRPGLSIARNRALREATGDIIVFVDDDGVLAPDYITTLQATWNKSTPACMGGSIAVEYLDLPPPGWSDAQEGLRGPFDKGDQPFRMKFSSYPEGCNIAYDRRLALAGGGFDERLGVRPDGPWAAEEMELCAWLDRQGYAILYHPGLRVTHRLRRTERSPRWLRRMAWYRGRSHAYTLRTWFGRLRLRTALGLFFRSILSTAPWSTLEASRQLITAAGLLYETIRCTLARKTISPRPDTPSTHA